MFKNYTSVLIMMLFSTFPAMQSVGQAVETGYVNANNVNAGFSASGNFFSSYSLSSHTIDTWDLYEVPKGSNKRAIYTAALWMAGTDISSGLHLAGQRYRQGGEDYFPGPMSDLSSGTVAYCSQAFEISRQQVSDFQLLTFPTNWFAIDPAIREWPAKGNHWLDSTMSVNISRSMAPFVDVDGDGIYNPLKGDYPDFCGDDAVFFVYNDAGGVHTESGGAQLGVEVRGMAFEYIASGNSDLPISKRAVSNTVFLALDIENRSDNTYSNFRLGLFEDPDLGCFSNDRVGCDTTRNMMMVYNGSTPDLDCQTETGFGLYQSAHGAVLLNNSINDFVYFTNGSVSAIADPDSATQYQNYLSGRWNDGSSFTNGGTGYGGATPAKFCFPGDPNDMAQWSEVSVSSDLPAGDRRMMSSAPPMNFNLGEIKHFDFAFITSYDSLATLFGIVETLKSDVDTVQAFYNTVVQPCRSQLVASIKNAQADLELSVFPNPSNNQITIQASDNIQLLELCDLQGRSVVQLQNLASRYYLDVAKVAKGVYLLKVKSDDKVGMRKVVVD